MNIDADLRDLAASTRAVVAAGVDTDAELADLRLTHRRRRQVSVVVGLTVACLMAATFGILQPPATPRVAPAAGGAATDTNAASEAPHPQACHPAPGIRCLDSGLVLVEAATPYTFRLHSGFSPELRTRGLRTSGAIDIYQDRRDTAAGATLLTRVLPATRSGLGTYLDAHDLARWVAARPFVRASDVEAGVHDGLRSYSIDVSRERSSGPSLKRDLWCNRSDPSCRPLLTQQRGSRRFETGIRDSMVSRYTFIDVPGLGVVALWSWAMGRNHDALDRNAHVLDTVDFELPPGVYRNIT